MQAQTRYDHWIACTAMLAGLTVGMPPAEALEYTADIVLTSGDRTVRYADFWQKGPRIRITRRGGTPPIPTETTVVDLDAKTALWTHEPTKQYIRRSLRFKRRERDKLQDPLYTMNCLLDTYKVAEKKAGQHEGYDCEVTVYQGHVSAKRLVDSIGKDALLKAEGLTDEMRSALQKGDFSAFEKHTDNDKRTVWHCGKLGRIVKHVHSMNAEPQLWNFAISARNPSMIVSSCGSREEGGSHHRGPSGIDLVHDTRERGVATVFRTGIPRTSCRPKSVSA